MKAWRSNSALSLQRRRKRQRESGENSGGMALSSGNSLRKAKYKQHGSALCEKSGVCGALSNIAKASSGGAHQSWQSESAWRASSWRKALAPKSAWRRNGKHSGVLLA
jgi:hypothetical protein